MAQWINHHQNNSLIDGDYLNLLYEKCRAIALVLPGLTAVQQVGCTKLKKFKLQINQIKYMTFVAFDKGGYSTILAV